MKILIADDAELLRERMIALLSRLAGIESIFESHSCASTLDAIERDQPDLVLLDLRMPDGSGLEVLRAMHGRKHRPRILVLTTWSDPDVRQLCLDAGADDFFEKSTGFMGAVDAVEAFTTRPVA